MEPITVVLSMIALMLFLIALRMPIAFAIALAGSLGIVLLEDWATLLYTVGTFPVSRVATFAWSIIPLFVLMGNFSEASGLAADAYSMANSWLSRLKGGLVLVTIGSCGLIAATTGSGATGTAIMGKIAVPEMRKYGYDMKLATGAAASAGTVGILIPPSGSLVIIGVLAGLSIGKLFMAAILPGILSVLIYMAMVNARCMINPKLAPVGRRHSWKEKLLSLGKAWGGLLIFITIMGGLYTGIATAIEVAALGCFIALVMVFLAIARGKAEWVGLKEAVMDTISLCAMIFAFIIAGMVQVLLSQELIAKWVGAESGMRGILIGSVAGGLCPGGPFVSLPVAAGLIRSGASIGTMVAFITGWSIWAVNRLPMEVGILGWKFTLIRIVSTAFLPPLSGVIAQLFFGGSE